MRLLFVALALLVVVECAHGQCWGSRQGPRGVNFSVYAGNGYSAPAWSGGYSAPAWSGNGQGYYAPQSYGYNGGAGGYYFPQRPPIIQSGPIYYDLPEPGPWSQPYGGGGYDWTWQSVQPQRPFCPTCPAGGYCP